MNSDNSKKTGASSSSKESGLELENQKHASQPPKKKKPPVGDGSDDKEMRASRQGATKGRGFKILLGLGLLAALAVVVILVLNL